MARVVWIVLLLASLAAAAGCEAGPQGEIPLRILAINDFHGNIATSSDAFGGVGRADYLAANVAAARADVEHSVFVSAGDLIGASPLVSALFHDEPTVEAMNAMGLDVNGVGNHEFDAGLAELRRLQRGGPHPVDPDADGQPFAGAAFDFLAANVIDDATGETIFPPYVVRRFAGVDVAFIGLTLQDTPSIVAADAIQGLSFRAEAQTVNALVPALRGQGIEAIVVLLHLGGASAGGPSDCGSGLTGPLAEVVADLHEAVDVVIAGHSNDEFVCRVGGTWVTMADSRGRLFTIIDAVLDPATGDLAVRAAENVPNAQAGVTPDPVVAALIDRYVALSATRANAVIGAVAAGLSREPNAAGESPLGGVIADAHLASTQAEGAVVAFTNSGGIRTGLPGGADGGVTYGEAFAAQPFGNSLVTMTLTGAQIETLLESQFRGEAGEDSDVLQVSRGFSYAWNASRPIGDRVDPATIAIHGVSLDPAAPYRVTANSFLADGGDGFTVFTEGTERIGGALDIDALVAYFGVVSPVGPGPQARITRLN